MLSQNTVQILGLTTTELETVENYLSMAKELNGTQQRAIGWILRKEAYTNATPARRTGIFK